MGRGRERAARAQVASRRARAAAPPKRRDGQILYIWDEWVAYTNGATVAIDRYTRGLDPPTSSVDDNLFAVLEFTVYALTAGMAASLYDPVGFAQNAQLRAFMAWQAQRAMTTFRAGIALPPFRWKETDGFYAALRSSPDAEALRQLVRATYGAAWTYAMFGF